MDLEAAIPSPSGEREAEGGGQQILLLIDISMVPTEVEDRVGQPTASDVRKVLGEVEEAVDRGVKVGWVSMPQTPATVREVLAETACLHSTSRPLYSTKLAKLLCSLVGRETEEGWGKAEGGELPPRNLREQALVATGIAQVGEEARPLLSGAEKEKEEGEGAKVLPKSLLQPPPVGDGGEATAGEDGRGGKGEGGGERTMRGRTVSTPPLSAAASKLKEQKEVLKGVEILLAEDTPVLRK